MDVNPQVTTDRRDEMVQDCLSTLHAIVKDPKQPATARQQATRTLLEVLGIVGGRGGASGVGQAARASAAHTERAGAGLAELSDSELRNRLNRLRELQEEIAGLVPGAGIADTENQVRPTAVVSPLD